MPNQQSKIEDVQLARNLISQAIELYERNWDWWTREQIYRALSCAASATKLPRLAMRANEAIENQN